jgi:hypothetical protein
VLGLLAGREDTDALLLRLAIAQQRLGLAAAPANIAILQARFDATRQRGDSTHGREEARFMLELHHDAAAALALAQANWRVQKEPADALVLIAAAREAGQVELVQQLLASFDAQGWQDVRLHAPARASVDTVAVASLATKGN